MLSGLWCLSGFGANLMFVDCVLRGWDEAGLFQECKRTNRQFVYPA